MVRPWMRTALIPKLADKDSFDRLPLIARSRAVRAVVRAPQADRDASRAVKGSRPPVGLRGPPGRGIAPRTAPARRTAKRHQMGLYQQALVLIARAGEFPLLSRRAVQSSLYVCDNVSRRKLPESAHTYLARRRRKVILSVLSPPATLFCWPWSAVVIRTSVG